jgi:type III pantothenate kinase
VNLVVDIGNSTAKAALFEGGGLVRTVEIEDLKEVSFDGAIVVSTRSGHSELERWIEERARFFVRMDAATPVPITNLYATPATLGCDRLAAAVGATAMFPGQAALVVDFGTAITFDLITAAGEFLGGNISPGARSRFRALHEFTGALPMGSLPDELCDFPAGETKTAIESGVVMGILAETERYRELSQAKSGDLKVIFTGGDAEYFAGRVNFPIFVAPTLVFYGLNAILEHNANK